MGARRGDLAMETITSPASFGNTQERTAGEQPGDEQPGLFRLLEDLLEGALCDGICRAGTCCLASRPRTPRTALISDEAIHDVWYFTFGANMHANTLARRGVGTVPESLTGSLPDYRLAFTYEGYEGCESRFANIEPLGGGGGVPVQGVPVQGVAHRLSQKQMKLLDGFEGEGSAYERIPVTFVAAAAEVDAEASDGGVAAQRFEVQAYVAMPSHTAPPGLPSARCVKLKPRPHLHVCLHLLTLPLPLTFTATAAPARPALTLLPIPTPTHTNPQLRQAAGRRRGCTRASS